MGNYDATERKNSILLNVANENLGMVRTMQQGKD